MDFFLNRALEELLIFSNDGYYIRDIFVIQSQRKAKFHGIFMKRSVKNYPQHPRKIQIYYFNFCFIFYE